MLTSLNSPYKAIVFGATGTLGRAFVQAISNDPNCSLIIEASRSESPYRFDLQEPQSLLALAQQLKPMGPFALMIDATGFLHGAGFKPEKRLKDTTLAQLEHTFHLNAFSKALLLQAFVPLMAQKERSIFGFLSARVGSITDNHLGGWLSYRASKAAANMIVQTIALEVQRTNKEALFCAMQPGTVHSNLSAPFSSNHPLTDPQDAAMGLLLSVNTLEPKEGAYFIDYRGNSIPW